MPGLLPLCVTFVLNLLLPGIVQAGLLATWSMQRGHSMTMEYQDKENFRINVGDSAYILMSQGKGYTVSQEGDEWVATSIESLKKMMEQSGMADLLKQAQGEAHQHQDLMPSIKETGRTETVAGITGQVYLLNPDPNNKKEKPLEVVFSNDPRLRRIQEAHIQLGKAWGTHMHGQGGSLTDLMQRYDQNGPGGALLRYADIMRLESLEDVDLKDSRFTVPRIAEMGMPAMPHGSMKGRHKSPPRMPKMSAEEQEQFRRAMEEMQKRSRKP